MMTRDNIELQDGHLDGKNPLLCREMLILLYRDNS